MRSLKGLHIHGFRANREVRKSLIKFARWLRTLYDFPVRVNVYLSPNPHIISKDGERVSATFFVPDAPCYYPFIRIATGDYLELKNEVGKDNALAANLCSLAHEVIHYRQWIETGNMWEQGVKVRVRDLVDKYAETTDHP